jgi:hypothetical protein
MQLSSLLPGRNAAVIASADFAIGASIQASHIEALRPVGQHGGLSIMLTMKLRHHDRSRF